MVVLTITLLAGSHVVEEQRIALKQHANELALHRQYAVKLFAEIEALQEAAAADDLATVAEGSAR